MYSIWILTRPLVFLPGAGTGFPEVWSSCTLQLSSVSLMLELRSSCSSLCILFGEKLTKGSVALGAGLGLYLLSPSILEVIPAGCPADLNFKVVSFLTEVANLAVLIEAAF